MAEKKKEEPKQKKESKLATKKGAEETDEG